MDNGVRIMDNGVTSQDEPEVASWYVGESAVIELNVNVLRVVPESALVNGCYA